MGAMTLIYAVNNQRLLREVRAGDQVMGKVYDGESILRHVEIVAVTARSRRRPERISSAARTPPEKNNCQSPPPIPL